MGKQGTPEQRREREAAALRANLLRRKAQGRERDQDHAEAGPAGGEAAVDSAPGEAHVSQRRTPSAP